MALSARRALQVLDFLTVNQRRSFTLSELSKALEVSPGSMFAILRALNDAGYVLRHPRHKTYTLGMAAATVGRAASDVHPVMDLARTEMVQLAARTGHECARTVLVGKAVLCVAIEGKPTGRPLELVPGQRVPLVPPLGQPFMVWMPPAEMRDWMDGLPEDLRDRVATYLRTYGPVVRRRGYTIGLDDGHDSRPELTHRLVERPNETGQRDALLQHFLDGQSDYAVLEVDDELDYNVGNIAAPVFDPDGRVAFCLTLLHLGRLRGADITGAARPLAASAELLTREIGGRAPSQFEAEGV